jgi:hypothetical protein
MIKIHNLKHWALQVNGRLISGYAQGDDAIKLEQREATASDVVGAAGDMMVNVSANDSHMIKIKLLPTAEDNDYLAALYEAFLAGNIPVLAASLTNTRTGESYHAVAGYIPKKPALQLGDKGTAREWEIVVASMVSTTSAARSIVEAINGMVV